jgi:hypothetical protein
MRTDMPEAYQTLVNTSVDCMAHIARLFHPANPEDMFRATVYAATKRAETNPSKSTVSALINQMKELLSNFPRDSIEKRMALAAWNHHFGDHPEFLLSRYAKTKANGDLKALLQGEKLECKKFS